MDQGWFCETCGTGNVVDGGRCLGCGAPRPPVLGSAKHSPIAIVALVCAVGGVLSIAVVGWGAALPIVAAAALGHFALRRIRLGRGREVGLRTAVAALVIAYVCIGFTALVALAYFALLSIWR